MKKTCLLMTLLMAGCSVKPIDYDTENFSHKFSPIEVKENIENLQVIDFDYEPHLKISAHSTSFLGCLPCSSDGSTVGFVYSKPVSEIIRAEVEQALSEVLVPTNDATCQLGAKVHMVAWDAVDGDTVVDITYILKQEGNIEYIRRIRAEYDNGILESSPSDRLFAKATRQSVSTLVSNKDFINTTNAFCSNSSK
ncbi:hypothetical protein [Enterovibrio norvegicus]|uniref:hypothetical protein n=1 Tax=Enterovibrio norvegicus TaxID=188144 RepID=UPI0035513715